MADQRSFPWLVITLVWLGWFSIMLPWTIITPLLPLIEDEYRISHSLAGWLMSGYHLFYALMQVPSGAMSDKFGRKKPLAIGVFGSSLAAFLVTFTQNFNQLLILRFLTGLFSGLWYAPSTALVAGYTREQDRGKALGIAVTGFPVSSVILYTMVGFFSGSIQDWRIFFLICSLPGFLCSLLLATVIREPKNAEKIPESKKNGIFGSFGSVCKSSSFIAIALYNLLAMQLFYVLQTFLPTYFVKDRGLTVSETSYLLTVNSTAMILCGPVSGYLNDKLGFKKPLLLFGILMSVTTYSMPYLPLGLPIIGTMIVLGIIGQWYGPIISALASQIAPLNVRGMCLGLINLTAFIGATIGPIAFGYIADIKGFNFFFIALFFACILAVLMVFIIERTQRKQLNQRLSSNSLTLT